LRETGCELATILHRMWVDGVEFRSGSDKAADVATSKRIDAIA
jgi:hypothetical protein